jgi:hypothetical protein
VNVRPEVVQRLVSILTDDALSTDDRLAQVFAAEQDATAAERYAAAQHIAEVSVEHLVQAGMVNVAAEPATVLDLTMRQLQCLAAVWGVMSRWDASLKLDRTMGALLKTMPGADVDVVARILAWGGFA